jgi:hypothetical protein
LGLSVARIGNFDHEGGKALMKESEKTARRALRSRVKLYERAKRTFWQKWEADPLYAIGWQSPAVVRTQVEAGWASRVLSCEEGLEEGFRQALPLLESQVMSDVPRWAAVFPDAVEAATVGTEARLYQEFRDLLDSLVEERELEFV